MAWNPTVIAIGLVVLMVGSSLQPSKHVLFKIYDLFIYKEYESGSPIILTSAVAP